MITGDSSSPSILLMNSPNGVMPILFGLVTYAGPGQGPKVSQLTTQIQGVIQSFGDSHKILTAPPPAAPVAAPTCSITATRIASSSNCNLTVTTSSDPVTGNPITTPSAPATWTRAGNIWSGRASCSTTAPTTFQATLSGQGGKGPTCESAVIAPIANAPILPTCSLSVLRVGTSDNCNYSAMRTSAAGSVRTLNILGTTTTWDGNTPTNGILKCSQTSDTLVDATVTGPNGSSTCSAIAARLTAPSCFLAASRQENTASCSLQLTGSGVIDTSKQPTIASSSSGRWNGSNWTGTASCSTTAATTFDATIDGLGGVKANCKSNTVAALQQMPSRTCNATAVRNNQSGSCFLTVNVTGELAVSPKVSPYPSSAWSRSGNVWSSAVSCPTNKNTIYSITLTGPGNTNWGCGSNKVTAITK